MSFLRVLLTGATGYIGKRLLPVLLSQGHEVVCVVRDARRFAPPPHPRQDQVSVVEADLLESNPLDRFPAGIDAAYYLIHSMSTVTGDFQELEARAASEFVRLVDSAGARQIIYLGGITPETKLSRHLASRQRVGDILRSSRARVTELQAGIIIGAGSASFEIMRDLVEKLPVMIAPRWLNVRHQPIAVHDVLACLSGVLFRDETLGRTFHVGGPDVLTYKEMLLAFARVRGLKRFISTVPVMTPRLSSYWLYFITSTSYRLAVSLVDSMKIEVVARDNELIRMLGIAPLHYAEAVQEAFTVIQRDDVESSWKDAMSSSARGWDIPSRIEVPEHGCLRDRREQSIPGDSGRVLDRIWAIGGDNGWYHANALWRIRGIIDKLAGGVGLRRGRTSRSTVRAGDTIDFWRVLVADRSERRLLLFAEMKLPGEAWLEFRILESNGRAMLRQTATFRPRGLLGRLYWYSILPLHAFVFEGMLRGIIAQTASDRGMRRDTVHAESHG